MTPRNARSLPRRISSAAVRVAALAVAAHPALANETRTAAAPHDALTVADLADSSFIFGTA